MSDTPPDETGAAVRFPPPLVPLIALVAGIGLQMGWPLPFALDGAMRWAVGGILTASGLAILLIAAGLLRESGQDPKPWVATPEIISTGIYAYTRNPMYLSMGLMTVGIGTLLGNLWVVASLPLVWGTIYWIAIRHEEAYLEQKFGITYTSYKESVRRWL